ncbi:hypothetical protein PCC7424_5811 (plasmid) [Gloeothece citriformis PCC 7424]|uniref:Uncharacterized protein n=1 Tax=Gloeothece citriformis (strain PCC 7424) TaxID=65393 RepID=B7KM50_GLOC7|nr:hypothetical protein PCC7424_5811 [Gloeothece citriformis PCC 7424]
MIRSFLQKLLKFFSEEVPSEIVACEFDCRQEQCLNEDFDSCPRRLQKAEALKRLSQG